MKKVRIVLFAIICSVVHFVQGQTEFWGTTPDGGLTNAGVAFKTDANGQNFQLMHTFGVESPGRIPTYTKPVLGANGKYYVLTSRGGVYGKGAIIEHDLGAGTHLIKYSFKDTMGMEPNSYLTAVGNRLYGTTTHGGNLGSVSENYDGVLFYYDVVQDTLVRIYDFNSYGLGSNSGGNPYGPLIESGGYLYGHVSDNLNDDGGTYRVNLATHAVEFLYEIDDNGNPSAGRKPKSDGAIGNGNYYMVTSTGSSNNVGALVKNPLGSSSTLNTLLVLNNTLGTAVNGGGGIVIVGSKLYLTLPEGGSGGAGTIVSYDTVTMIPAILQAFDGSAAMGGKPFGSMLPIGGNLYGTTSEGGANGAGILFKYTIATGTLTKLADFEQGTGGGRKPLGGLVEANGILYGCSSEGIGAGALFQYDTTSQVLSTIVRYDYAPGGQTPRGTMLAANGLFYGTTSQGGINGHGTVFSINPANGVFTKLADFNESVHGRATLGGLMKHSDGKFYGAASKGGANGDGTLYSFDPATNVITKIYDFDSINGKEPHSVLYEVNGNFYGTTLHGGTDDLGTVFKYNLSSGTYTMISDLDNATGALPCAGLVRHEDKLYGVARYAGPNGAAGTLFSIDTLTNNLSVIHGFTGTVTGGGSPLAQLINVGGVLYGVSQSFGANGNGTVYKYEIATSTFTGLPSFLDTTIGHGNISTFLEHNGKLFGLNTNGGPNGGNTGDGSIYYYDIAADTIVRTHVFSGIDGRGPKLSALVKTCLPPTITSISPDQSGCNGDTINLVATVTGSVQNQWEKDGTPLVGETNLTLNLNGLNAGMLGEYVLAAYDECGNATRDTVQVTLNPGDFFSDTASICQGDSIELFGSYQTTPGLYWDSLSTVNGCDSVYHTLLIVNPVYYYEDTVDICQGDSAMIGGVYYATPGVYIDSLQTIAGCDSIIPTLLVVHSTYLFEDTVVICQGDSALIFGAYETVAGIYTDNYQTVAGCDSSYQTMLIVNPTYFIEDTAHICQGDSILLDGVYQTSAGIYTELYMSVDGCDSTIQTTLFIDPTYLIDDDTLDICDGDSVLIYGVYQSVQGVYSDPYTSISGCDSTHQQYLVVHPHYLFEETIEICEGDSALIYGNYYSQPGFFEQFYQSIYGCDSIYQTTLIVNDIADLTVTVATPTLTANMSGMEYQWIDCDDNLPITGETNQSYTITANGSYAVIITDSGSGCFDTTDCVVIDNLLVDELTNAGLKIYPNPSHGDITISIANGTIQSVEIIDTKGSVVYSESVAKDVSVIDLKGIKSGVYFVMVKSSAHVYTKKLILTN